MKKIIKILGYIIVIVLFLLYVIYPISMGYIATRNFNKNVGSAPAGFENVEITTSDNVKLKAWYAEPKNGKVIIVVHGATSSRNSVRKHIEMLFENGYGVLAFDMRGHGESNGNGAVAYNWDSDKDIKAVVNYLLQKENVKLIGALGLSLGGEILLGGASSNEEIKAIISEGASQRTINDYLVLEKNRNIFKSYTSRLMYFAVKTFSQANEPIRMVDSIKNSKNTIFLFIAAGKETDEIDFNTYFNNLIKDRSELWIIENSGHTQGIKVDKDNYNKKILEFYDEHLK